MDDTYVRQANADKERQDKIDFQNWLLTGPSDENNHPTPFPQDEKSALANLNQQLLLSAQDEKFVDVEGRLSLLHPSFAGITSFDDFVGKFPPLPKRKDIDNGKTTRKPTEEEQKIFVLNLYRAIVQHGYFQAKTRIFGESEPSHDQLYYYFNSIHPYLLPEEKQTIMATLPIIAYNLAKYDADIAFSGKNASQFAISDYIEKESEAIQERCKNIAMKQQMGFWSTLWARIKKTFTLGAFALTCLAALFIIPVAIVNPAFEGAWGLYILGAITMLYPLWRFFFRPPNYYRKGDNLGYEPANVTYSAKISQAYDRQPWYLQILIVLVGLATIAGLAYESRDFLIGIWSPKDVFALSSSSGYVASALAYLPLLATAIFIVAAIYIINQNPAEIPAAPPANLSVSSKSAPPPNLSQANPNLFALSSSMSPPLVSSSSQASTSTLSSASSANGSGTPVINVGEEKVTANRPIRI
ncbi:MAG: hypothetical protein M1561_08310 [Gammaproteobacteria bacterium]|nr:hypothetical protein [Gammaproteobacteria bacterium]